VWPFGRDKPLGPKGEDLARRALRKRGMKILARNYRCPAGEIDLIVLDPSTRKDLGSETIAFVEVKTRSSDRYTDPEAAVDAEKQRRIRKVANYYLARHDAADLAVRFDIVSVLIRPGEKPQVKHIPQAF